MIYFLIAIIFIILLARTEQWEDFTINVLLALIALCIVLGIWEIVA
jgi:hypothetical protein